MTANLDSLVRRLCPSFRRPPALHPYSKCSKFDAKFDGEIGQAPFATSVFNKMVLRCVAGLLGSRGPTAVRRLIVSIVVDALKGGSVRPLAHVSEKVGVCLPRLSDLYSPTAVSSEADRLGIVAPLPHPHPACPCWLVKVLVALTAQFDPETFSGTDNPWLGRSHRHFDPANRARFGEPRNWCRHGNRVAESRFVLKGQVA
jgi:hypothetical protein